MSGYLPDSVLLSGVHVKLARQNRRCESPMGRVLGVEGGLIPVLTPEVVEFIVYSAFVNGVLTVLLTVP